MKSTKIVYIISLLFSALLLSAVSVQAVSEEARRHMARGDAAMEMAKSPEDYEAAIKEFQKAARLAPGWADPYYKLALVQEKAGKFREAITSLNRYLQLAPNALDGAKVKDLIYKLEYKAEQVLSVPAIIDVLVSFSNKELWKKVGGECFMDKQFSFIKYKDNNSVEVPVWWNYDYERPDPKGGWEPKEIEGPMLKWALKMNFRTTSFHCSNEIEVVSRTQVKVRQKIISRYPVSGGELVGDTPPGIKLGHTYSCEYRKK